MGVRPDLAAWSKPIANGHPLAAVTGSVRFREGARMQAMGQRLRDGLSGQARKHGIALRQSGPVQMPVLLFDQDDDRRIGNAFCLEALARGVYLHPTHTLFLSTAHTETDMDAALAVTDEAFAAVCRM